MSAGIDVALSLIRLFAWTPRVPPIVFSSTHRSLLSLAVIASFFSGCANWKEDPSSARSGLPAIRENAHSVILDVEFVPIRVAPDDIDTDASLWQWIDETAIDPVSRRRWIDNGLRIGKLLNEGRYQARLGHLSPNLDVVDQFLGGASVASEISHGGKRTPIRLGRRYELPLRQPVAGNQVTLLRRGEETIGRTLVDPQYLFAVTVTPGKSAGLVDVRLRPEIHHGATKQKWVSSDSALRIDTRRETWSLEELDIEFTGSEGDVFVVSGRLPSDALGKQMLSGEAADQTPLQVVVIIRIDQIPDPAGI